MWTAQESAYYKTSTSVSKVLMIQYIACWEHSTLGAGVLVPRMLGAECWKLSTYGAGGRVPRVLETQNLGCL